ncbi:MAG: hypothetical protein HY246_26735 [Proteobacteria bacterium]|nr:hypothetical protein [Pseudomonadota bacterium]
MRKFTSLALALGLGLAIIPAAAFAQSSNTPVVDKRQQMQQKRIERGVQSGQLTPVETARLERGQGYVDQMERRAKADGIVTPEERHKLKQAQDTQSKRIARQKNDQQVR